MSQTRPTKSEVDTYAGHYVLYGEQSNAWRATFINSKCKPETVHEKASRFHALANVQARIEELTTKVRAMAEKELNIDAAWVLKQAVKVHERCMQSEPVMSQGEPTGEFKFEAAGANKSLEIIGKLTSVAAFTENINLNAKIKVDKSFNAFYEDE